MVGFILFPGIFMGFLFCYSFFMGHEALNIKGILMLFSWDSHAIFMVFFREKPMKNMWIYHEKFHRIFMGFNFIVNVEPRVFWSTETL